MFILVIQSRLYSQFSYQWETSQLYPPHEIFKSKYLDENTGFATALKSSENKSKIIKTTDSGNNWSTVLSWSPYSQYTTFDVYGSNLWVYHQYQIYHSTNYGATWSPNVYDMQNIVGSTPSEQVVMKFFNQNTGYLTYVNQASPYPTLFIFKTDNGGDTWYLVYTRTGNINAPYKFSINDLSFVNNDANHVLFGGFMSPWNDLYRKGIITLETTDGFNTVSFDSDYTGSEDCFCYNSVRVLPNSPDQKRIILSKYKYSNSNHPDNGMYCRIKINGIDVDYKIDNEFAHERYGGVNFSDNNIGYSYIFDKIFRTSNSGVNWTLVKDQLPLANYCKFRINSFGDIVYSISNDGYFVQKYISTNINSVTEYQQSFNGYFTLNGETWGTPFNYFIKGGIREFFANASENKMFYKWNDGNMSSNRVISVMYDNFNLIANYKTLGKADNEYAIANSNQTKSFRDTNGNINQIYESMGGLFYTRSTDNGASFSTEQIVNSEGDGNKNAFISEVRQQIVTPIDPNANVVAVWQRREGNNEVIKLAYREDGINPIYNWVRYSAYDVNVPSTNTFNLHPKCFIHKRSEISGDFFSLVTYLKPNGSNIDLMVTAKANPGATPNNFTIASGNISEYSVTKISEGMYQTLFFAYIKDNEVYFKCYKYTWYGMPNLYVAQSTDINNPDFTVSSYPNDNQDLRISPDISLRNGRPIVTYRARSVIQRIVKIPGNEENMPLSMLNFPIFVRYKYLNTSNQEVWSTPIIYNSAGVEQKNPNIEGCKNSEAFVLNYNINNQCRQVSYLQTGPGYCSPGQYTVNDAKLVRGSFYSSSNQYSSPMLLTLTQSGSLYNIGKETFSISSIPISNSSVQDNLIGTIREANTNYNFNLGPIVAKNTNVAFSSESETSVTNPVEFCNTMTSAPFNLGPNDTLILNGTGYYHYITGNPFLQKRFTVNLMSKSTQLPYMTLFADSIGVLDTVETEYLRGYVFSGDDIPQVDSFYVQLFIDSTSLYQGDEDYSVCNAYSPDEQFDGDGPNSFSSRVHFFKGNHLSNNSNIPKEYSLSQNYPNPFNPVTNIKYQIPVNGFVSLKIYDITGREIANLVKEYKQAGYYTVTFNGSNLASGVYFYRIQAGDFVQVKKMVLIK